MGAVHVDSLEPGFGATVMMGVLAGDLLSPLGETVEGKEGILAASGAIFFFF